MGIFLNSSIPYESYKEIVKMRFFVDKTLLLDDILDAVELDGQKYLCITRPRRFGKSVAAYMIGAFFGKAEDSSEVFNTLSISGSKRYPLYRNKHNVIYIDFSKMPEECNSYKIYIQRISSGLKEDLMNEYPELGLDSKKAVWDIFSSIFEKIKHKFIFVMDEWDAIFHKDFISASEKKDYLEFLKNLLKGQPYVELAYMTGVLPIAKYSSGSEINMFMEFDMAKAERFGAFFGFSDSEVDSLFKKYIQTTKHPKITRKEMQDWYDGYHTAAGNRLYNPRSVVYALTNNQLRNYWTSSGPYDEIFYYIKNNINDIRDDLMLMAAGEGVEAVIQEYAATADELNTKNQIYSAMVVYGLLTYKEAAGKVFIPNKELMDQFDQMLMSNESLGYVHSLARESARMLKATLAADTKTMAEILKFAHDTESPIFSYNSEIELSAVVNLVYLVARDKYRVEREDKAGEGYVDFIFYPSDKNADAFILELKIDSTPEDAICQIKNRNYALRFQGKLGEKPKYTGRILAVGISYDKKTKEHACKVEVLKEKIK